MVENKFSLHSFLLVFYAIQSSNLFLELHNFYFSRLALVNLQLYVFLDR